MKVIAYFRKIFKVDKVKVKFGEPVEVSGYGEPVVWN